MSNLLTLKAAAAKLKISNKLIRNLIEAKHLEVMHVGRRMLVSDAAIAKFKASVAA
jgi:excisionase family DNA binding protein